jgi:hypothetical protein
VLATRHLSDPSDCFQILCTLGHRQRRSKRCGIACLPNQIKHESAEKWSKIVEHDERAEHATDDRRRDPARAWNEQSIGAGK